MQKKNLQNGLKHEIYRIERTDKMMESAVEYDFPENAVPDMPEQRCYTVEDLQNILRCGRTTVYDLLKKNEFRYFRLGGSGYRISRKSFDKWLDKQC